MDEGVPVNVEMMQQMAAQMGTQGAAGTMMQPAAGAEAAQAPQQVAIPKAQLEDLNLIRQDWGKIIREQGGSIRPSFRDTVLEPSGDSCLCIVFSNSDNYAIGSPSDGSRGTGRSMWRSSTARPCILKRACATPWRAFKHHLRQ